MIRAALACLLTLCLGACAGGNVLLANTDSGKSLTLPQGQTLELQLRSNPGTGYSWQLAGAGEVLRQQGPMVFMPDPHDAMTVGSGGTEVWRLRAVKPGRQTLRLEYRRPWEKDAPAAETFTCDITVP